MKARLPQGYGGGGGDMNSMLRQAQKMQENMEKVREELEQQEYSITSGGGAVEVTITGRRSTRARIISKERLPDPMMMEQRNSRTGTPADRRSRPTSWRLRKWAESFSWLSPRPPRYTIR